MRGPYRVPLYPVLPALVLVMSLFAAAVYAWEFRGLVLWLTAALYAASAWAITSPSAAGTW